MFISCRLSSKTRIETNSIQRIPVRGLDKVADLSSKTRIETTILFFVFKKDGGGLDCYKYYYFVLQ